MKHKLTLMTPGPTPVPEPVLRAMGCHPMGHRSSEFENIVSQTSQQLRWLHQTSSDVLTITGSGTAAMEAGIVNTLSAKDKVLCGDNGKFGERWIEVARAYNLDIEVIKSPWGQPLDPEAFRAILEADTEQLIKAVILTHSETSTGVINDLQTISQYVNNHGAAISIVDCVTSIGVCNVPVDEWGLDVVCSGSQKGYMMPPGLGFISISQRAWKSHIDSNLPKFYLNLSFYRETSKKHSSPFTPAVNLYFALATALNIMNDEGLESIFIRHKKHSHAIQSAIKAMGLSLYALESHSSPAVTAVQANNFDIPRLVSRIKDRFDILLAGGQDHLKEKIFRIGHLGFICDRDILTVVTSIEAALHDIDSYKVKRGQGVSAAISILNLKSN